MLIFGNEYYKIMLMAQGLQLAIYRLRQRFSALLREQIAQKVSSETKVDEELQISHFSAGIVNGRDWQVRWGTENRWRLLWVLVL
jgi:anti-sigma-K factor RskA